MCFIRMDPSSVRRGPSLAGLVPMAAQAKACVLTAPKFEAFKCLFSCGFGVCVGYGMGTECNG